MILWSVCDIFNLIRLIFSIFRPTYLCGYIICFFMCKKVTLSLKMEIKRFSPTSVLIAKFKEHTFLTDKGMNIITKGLVNMSYFFTASSKIWFSKNHWGGQWWQHVKRISLYFVLGCSFLFFLSLQRFDQTANIYCKLTWGTRPGQY